MTRERTRGPIEADWNRRGFSCGLWTDPPGQVWRDYIHDVDELVTVLEGSLEIDLGGIVRIPEPGEEVFIPAGTKHTVRNVGETNAKWLYGYKRQD